MDLNLSSTAAVGLSAVKAAEWESQLTKVCPPADNTSNAVILHIKVDGLSSALLLGEEERVASAWLEAAPLTSEVKGIFLHLFTPLEAEGAVAGD